MTFLGVLLWAQSKGCTGILWPTWVTAGCVSPGKLDVLADRIESERRSPCSDRANYFVEIARNGRGELCGWAYRGPRPAGWASDVHDARDGESMLPARLQEPDAYKHRCFEGDPQEYEFFYQPYEFGVVGLGVTSPN